MKKVRFFRNNSVASLEERHGYYLKKGINEFVIAPKDKEHKCASIYDFNNGNLISSFSTIRDCVKFIRTCKNIANNIFPDFINDITRINVKGFVNPVYNKQRIDNIICAEVAMRIELFCPDKNSEILWKEFKYCSAQIGYIYSLHYLLLKSYNTIVAAYDMDSDIVYDFLRYSYGFTRTSCQHINKFIKQFNPISVVTYRDI